MNEYLFCLLFGNLNFSFALIFLMQIFHLYCLLFLLQHDCVEAISECKVICVVKDFADALVDPIGHRRKMEKREQMLSEMIDPDFQQQPDELTKSASDVSSWKTLLARTFLQYHCLDRCVAINHGAT